MTIEASFALPAISSNRALLVLLSAFLACMSSANGQEVIEAGNNCTTKSKLPQSFLCADGLVVDCRSSTNPQQQLYCAASEFKKNDNELNRLYLRALKKLEKPNDEYADYQSARKALIESQRAWMKFKKTDCEVAGYLNLKGSIQSNEVIDCELKHAKNRIFDLNTYFAP